LGLGERAGVCSLSKKEELKRGKGGVEGEGRTLLINLIGTLHDLGVDSKNRREPKIKVQISQQKILMSCEEKKNLIYKERGEKDICLRNTKRPKKTRAP